MKKIGTKKQGWLMPGILMAAGPFLLGTGTGPGAGPPSPTNSPPATPAPVFPQPANPQNPNPSSPYYFPRSYPQGRATYVPINQPPVRPAPPSTTPPKSSVRTHAEPTKNFIDLIIFFSKINSNADRTLAVLYYLNIRHRAEISINPVCI